MILVIAEKPSVASTIAAVLGANDKGNSCYKNGKYIVSWCVGHLVDLAPPEAYGQKYADKWSFDNLPVIPSEWIFDIHSPTKAQFAVLKALMNDKSVTEIVCATDAGREGECIFRYVYNKAYCKKPVKRLWTSSLEESAIREGFASLKDDKEYDNLYAAGFARAKADWLVGMNATRLFTVKYHTLLSIGRVQTPTLAMIVERNNKVSNFVKEKYYTVDIDCGNGIIASSENFSDRALAERLQNEIDGRDVYVQQAKTETKTVNPPKLYDLTTLQREANRIYGYTAQQTLDYTQSLYEKKLCTYPRTDSRYITDDMEQTARNLVGIVCNSFTEFNAVNIASPNVKRLINNAKVSYHHALLPTAEISNCDLSSLPSSELNILRLISQKLLCAVSEPHIYAVQRILLSDKFSATLKCVTQNGWKELDISKEKKSEKNTFTDLPNISVGKVFPAVKASTSEHLTSPPKQYTDDTLLSAMETAGNDDYDGNSDVEKKGLGTPATRAGIIENLVKRGYIERTQRKLLPTDKGVKLINCVPADVKSPKMTAEWETGLQGIEKGKVSADDFISSTENYIKQLMEKYAVTDNANTFKKEWQSVGTCPKCGKRVLDYPKAYSCESGKGGCGFYIFKKIAGKEISQAQAIKLLKDGKTDLIKGFKSKTGKTFSAYLTLNSENRIEFVFPKRK